MINHIISSMVPKTGRMAVDLPQGALFRGGAEAKIRRKLLDMDLIEVVIPPLPKAIAEFRLGNSSRCGR